MADSANEFQTIRIKAATKSRLEDIQDSIRREKGKKPPVSDLIEKALDLLSNPPQLHEPPARVNEEWHAKLDIILSEGDERDRIGIEQNIDWAVSVIRSRSGKPGGRRKAS